MFKSWWFGIGVVAMVGGAFFVAKKRHNSREEDFIHDEEHMYEWTEGPAPVGQ